jgi:nicotinamide-nucleotide amidase
VRDLEQELSPFIEQLAQLLTGRGALLTCAESCTGGLAAALLTAMPGCSSWFDRGFVAYSNASKSEMLSVSLDTLETLGSVSESTVAQMAAGAVARSNATVAMAMSGVAGPAGGSVEKPVGTVCLAWYLGPGVIDTTTEHFDGDRASIRAQTVWSSVQGLLSRLVA